MRGQNGHQRFGRKQQEQLQEKFIIHYMKKEKNALKTTPDLRAQKKAN